MKMIDQETVHRFSRLNVEAMAMNDAALADDLDEARFRARLIRADAEALGLSEIVALAEDILALLRSPGTEPLPGYGRAILKLATVLMPR